MNSFEYFIEFMTNPLALLAIVASFVAGVLSMLWTLEVKRKEENRNVAKERAADGGASFHSKEGVVRKSSSTEFIPEDTRLERAKKMLMNSEISNEAKSRFIARILHDIRNSLNVIMGMTQLAEQGDAGKISVNDIIAPINNAAKKLLSLTEDIAEFSTREKGGTLLSSARAPFNLENLCKDIVNEEKPSAEKNNTPIIFNYSQSLPKLFIGDSYKISHMLSLLLDYALRFTKNGSIILKVSEAGIKDKTAEGLPVEFRVEFGSEGIDLEDVETAFDFTSEDIERSKKSGNIRLGLAICGHLAESFGGSIGFKTDRDAGSVFSAIIFLPVKVAEQAQKAEKIETKAEDTARIEGKRALLAEDDPVNRQIEKIFLQRIGFVVETASNGSEALDKFKQNSYDIIFMDCDMPVLDGFSATRRIREIENDGRAKTPIIAMTAYALSGDRENCLEAGMDDYISKPVNVKGLLDISIRNIKSDNDKSVSESD